MKRSIGSRVLTRAGLNAPVVSASMLLFGALSLSSVVVADIILYEKKECIFDDVGGPCTSPYTTCTALSGTCEGGTPYDRIQTFPENYSFCKPEQAEQVCCLRDTAYPPGKCMTTVFFANGNCYITYSVCGTEHFVAECQETVTTSYPGCNP